MARELTHKQEGFVDDILKGKTGVEAAMNNYDVSNYNTAAVIASENLKKPKIVNAIEEALPDDLLAQVHREGLLATKGVYVKTEEGNEKVEEEPDHSVRHKFLDSAYKLKGSYAAEKQITLSISTVLDDLEHE